MDTLGGVNMPSELQKRGGVLEEGQRNSHRISSGKNPPLNAREEGEKEHLQKY